MYIATNFPQVCRWRHSAKCVAGGILEMLLNVSQLTLCLVHCAKDWLRRQGRANAEVRVRELSSENLVDGIIIVIRLSLTSPQISLGHQILLRASWNCIC